MKDLAIAAIALLLGYVGSLREGADAAQSLWCLGLLLVAGVLGQRLANSLRLPAVVAWLAGGLILGPNGLDLVRPLALAPLALVWSAAALWIGFQAGLHVSLPAALMRRAAGVVFVLTAASAAAATFALLAVSDLAWWAALLLGLLSSLWGPFRLVVRQPDRLVVSLATLGVAAGLFLLAAALGFLQIRGLLYGPGLVWIARVLGSLLLGGVGGAALRADALRRLHPAVLAAGVAAVLLAGAVLVRQIGLFALPCGLCAGVVAARQRVSARRLLIRLRPGSPVGLMLFCSLMGASMDLRSLWPLDPFLLRAVLAQVAAVIVVRGIGTALVAPVAAVRPRVRALLGCLLVPRGALLFELCLGPQHSVLELLGPGAASLLKPVVLGDILVHLVLLTSVASGIRGHSSRS